MSEIAAMTYHDQDKHNLDIDPAMILLGIGYATTLCVAMAWAASWII